MSKHHERKKAISAALAGIWAPLLLAAVAFFAYWPSLQSDFVYDARNEVLEEGFLTSFSNLPAVLSLKVLGMNLLLGTRPGQLLYMMLIAAVCGKAPFGYHLCSNLLHAANVALLFVLLLRLVKAERTGLAGSALLKVQLAAAAVTLIFALHPIATESVAEVSYSSSLLVTLFTLLALLAATAFRPENLRVALVTGGLGTFCAFAAATCKESGIAAPLMLIVYWFLFRRSEAKGPWCLFLCAATLVTALFMAARFSLAPPGQPGAPFLGGSFFQALLFQPRLWVFMMDKLVWPVGFSADYTAHETGMPSTSLAFLLLAIVLAGQAWLAYKSRLGALGVAIFWLGLATVSNFIPIYHPPLADRYYYLPLTGVAMQLLALLVMFLPWREGFWLAWGLCLGALVPMTYLTLTREAVFASEFSLWSDTVQVSPLSSSAHHNLGIAFIQKGQLDNALAQFQKSVELTPDYEQAHYNLGMALVLKGQTDEAMAQFQKALALNPNDTNARNNLGCIFLEKGNVAEGIVQFQEALRLNPDNADVQKNLAMAEKKARQASGAK